MLQFPVCHWGGGSGAELDQAVIGDKATSQQPESDFQGGLEPGSGLWLLDRQMAFSTWFKVREDYYSSGIFVGQSSGGPVGSRKWFYNRDDAEVTGGMSLYWSWVIHNTDESGNLQYFGSGAPKLTGFAGKSVSSAAVAGFDIWHHFAGSIRIPSLTSYGDVDVNLWLNGVPVSAVKNNGSPLSQQRGYFTFDKRNAHLYGGLNSNAAYDTWFFPTKHVVSVSNFEPAGGLGSDGSNVVGSPPPYFHTGDFKQFGFNRGDAGPVSEASRFAPEATESPGFPPGAGPIGF